jgi:hypothetical protein
MIFCPEQSIRKVERIPVLCDSCGYCSELTERSEALDAALVASGHLHTLRSELTMLRRLDALLSTVPAGRERYQSASAVKTAPELRQLLLDDPPLHEFLRRSSFLIIPRLQFVETAVREREVALPRSLLLCPSCSTGSIFVESHFFRTL